MRAGACPEAVASETSELKQINTVTETVEDFIFGYVFGYVDCVV